MRPLALLLLLLAACGIKGDPLPVTPEPAAAEPAPAEAPEAPPDPPQSQPI